MQSNDFEARWATLGNRAEFETGETLATIRFDRGPSKPDSEKLPRVDHLMALGAVLGVGGTGEVVSAHQTTLQRTIAVKRALKSSSEAGGSGLLREARVIGYLEHPNIPPVHFVGSDDGGELLVGLKHIEGETLTQALQAGHELEDLDLNLDRLIHVCNAVGFAHDRGILHLDIKPDNVMLGRHGEVYVVDWGLAVAWRDGVPPAIPRPSGDDRVRGTPAFLAPEMIVGGPFTRATDIYLLGGLLHMMLTGEPPNAGETVFDTLRSAYQPPEPRTFDAAVPAPLADICRRALAHDPDERFPDAESFREALRAFRRNRHETEAFETAAAAAQALSEALAESDDPALVYQRFGATRQALDEADRVNARPEESRKLLQQALESMIRWELNRENLGGAQLLLTQLPWPSAELRASCESLRHRLAEDRAELEAHRIDLDPSIATHRKALMGVFIGLVIALFEFVPYLMGIPPTAGRVLAGYLAYLCILALASFVLRRAFTTRTNRALLLAVWQLNAFGLLLRVGGYFDVMPLSAVIGYDLALVTIVAAYVATTFDRRIGVCVPVYAASAAASFIWPELALVIFGLGHLAGLSALAVVLVYVRAAR